MAPIPRKAAGQSGSSKAWEALTPALSEWILTFVSSMGYKQMQPVQASTLPVFMGNKDVVVEVRQGASSSRYYD